ncbi:MAG TPA: zinc-dependent alcohol dehydrogenase [Planctomycetaceae bacterium]
MKAVCWHAAGDVRVETVPDPKIEDPRDLVIKVTSTAICGSDLHIYDGFLGPFMQKGDVLGHEPMGEVVEVGGEVTKFEVGDRIVVPFTITCGHCFFCRKGLYSCCDNTNRNAELARTAMGHAPAGLYGYSHLTGGYAGGQAQYLLVKHADVGPIKVPPEVRDEQVLFLSDVFPTGWMAAENTDLEPGDTVAVWGCGPVGQFTIRSLKILGAGRVIAIDKVPERLRMAEEGGAETIDFSKVGVYDRLMELTDGRGPDRVVDAVGAEAAGHGAIDALLDKAKAALFLTTDRAHALREAIMCCRKGGTVSVPGVYLGFPDKFPMGAFMNKSLTMKTGQTHMPRYMEPLLGRIANGEIDPSFVVTHEVPIDDAPAMYRTFRDKKDGCVKVVLKPWA